MKRPLNPHATTIQVVETEFADVWIQSGPNIGPIPFEGTEFHIPPEWEWGTFRNARGERVHQWTKPSVLIQIAQSPCIPRFSVLVDGKWDCDCASNSEEVALAAARELYPDSEVIMWDDPRHYSNR